MDAINDMPHLQNAFAVSINDPAITFVVTRSLVQNGVDFTWAAIPVRTNMVFLHNQELEYLRRLGNLRDAQIALMGGYRSGQYLELAG